MKVQLTRYAVQEVFLALALLVSASLAHAQLPAGLPDAAVPGAPQSQPDEAFLYPELEPEPGKYIVPPVVDRPLGITEGPRIKIQAIDLRGVADRPKNNLTVDDIWKIIEAYRAAHPDGLTIGELQELANKVTNYYRDSGFIVAHAFIPVQTVEDGIVTIQVLEGVLGRVLVEGNKKYTPEQLAIPFEKFLGKPLTREEVESAVIRMGDYPGLTAFGVFQPGEKVGDSDLVLKAQGEKGGDISMTVDNHGSRFTGEWRAQTNFGVNNMFGIADRLDFGFRETFSPSNSSLASIAYSFMINKPQYRLEMGHSNNRFEIAESDLGVVGLNGISREAYLQFRNNYERGRLENAHWLFSINRKTAKTFRDEDRLARDHLTVLGVEWGFDSLDAESLGLNNFVIRFNYGLGHWLGAMDDHNDRSSSRRGGSGEFAGARFEKLFVSYTRLQTLSPTRSLLFKTNYQYTSDMLVALEQFAMGGPNSVRAYPASEQTTDRGIFVSAEHIWNAPGFEDEPSWFGNRKWGEVFTVSAFFDWAYGERIDPLPNEGEHESLKGWGLGAQLAVPGSFTAKLTSAWPIMGSPSPTNKRKPQVYFSLAAQLF